MLLESKTPYSNQDRERGPTVRVISEAQFCFSPDCIPAGAMGRDQVKPLFSVAGPHPSVTYLE